MDEYLTTTVHHLTNRLRDLHLDYDWEDGRRVINPDGLTENCYYCTVAYLGGYRSVHDLVQETGIMQQCRANINEIRVLFDTAGIDYRFKRTRDWLKAEALCSSGEGGLAYKRSDESGHMVAFCDGTIIDKQSNTRLPFEVLLDEGAYDFWFFFV